MNLRHNRKNSTDFLRLPLHQCAHPCVGNGVQLFVVVLQARLRNGFWEAPLREGRGIGRFHRSQRRDAEKLCVAIHEMGGRFP